MRVRSVALPAPQVRARAGVRRFFPGGTGTGGPANAQGTGGVRSARIHGLDRDRSRSTYENAFYSAEILRQKGVGRILLVTEAYHMVRSERCFRKLGLSVIPAPCGAHELLPVVSTFIPDGGAILDNEHALHEYIGLGWYGIKGRI